FLVPLDDDAAGHGGGLERNDGIQLALADDHAAGMLAEMARQIPNGQVEIQELRDERIFRRKAGLAELALGGFLGIGPAPGRNQRGKPAEIGFAETEHFSDVANGGAAAISDDVGGHSGAEFAVTLVNVLDHAFALIAARKIEIDVRPLAALF